MLLFEGKGVVIIDQMHENEVSKTCSTNKGDGKYVHRFSWKTWRNERTCEMTVLIKG